VYLIGSAIQHWLEHRLIILSKQRITVPEHQPVSLGERHRSECREVFRTYVGGQTLVAQDSHNATAGIVVLVECSPLSFTGCDKIFVQCEGLVANIPQGNGVR
jgi:hypothetical protein